MSKVRRREFVKAGAAVGAAATGVGSALAQAPAVITSRGVKPGGDLVGQRQRVQERRPAHRRRGGLRPHREGRRRARRGHRGRQHRRARPRGRQRGLRRPAQRRRRRAARRLLHARAAEAGGRGGRASRACARPRWWRRRCWTRPTTTCSWARARRSSRASWASRSRTTSTPRTRAKQWLEWKRRIDPEHYLDPAKREEAAARRREHGGRGPPRSHHVYGTINCNGVNAEGRDLRRHHHQRPGLEDPRPGGRLARSWARASTWTARWAPRAPPAAARPTSTTCPRT